MNARKSRERRRQQARAARAYLRQPYVREVLEAAAGAGPGVHHAHVYHEPWCPLLRGIGPCVCNPEVVVVDGDVH